MWQKWQRDIAKLSPKAIQIFAWGSGHYIQKQQPQLVVDAIFTLKKAAGKYYYENSNGCQYIHYNGAY